MTATLGERTDSVAHAHRASTAAISRRPSPTRRYGPPLHRTGPQSVEQRRILWTTEAFSGDGGPRSVEGPSARKRVRTNPCACCPGPRRTLPTQPRKGRRDDSETRVHPAGRLRPNSRRDWVTQARGLAGKRRRPEVVT